MGHRPALQDAERREDAAEAQEFESRLADVRLASLAFQITLGQIRTLPEIQHPKGLE